jgi:hypothetical protein
MSKRYHFDIIISLNPPVRHVYTWVWTNQGWKNDSILVPVLHKIHDLQEVITQKDLRKAFHHIMVDINTVFESLVKHLDSSKQHEKNITVWAHKSRAFCGKKPCWYLWIVEHIDCETYIAQNMSMSNAILYISRMFSVIDIHTK